MEVASAAARHPLHELLPEAVERDGHLHPRVRQVVVAVTEQHNVVMVREVAVGDRDRRGAHDRVYQAVGAIGQRAVVHPDLAPAVDGDAVAVGARPPTVVRWRGAHVGLAS